MIRREAHIAFSPASQFVVTGSVDTTARVLNARSGKQLIVLRGGDMVTDVAFHPDARRILAGRRDGTARIFDCAELGRRRVGGPHQPSGRPATRRGRAREVLRAIAS